MSDQNPVGLIDAARNVLSKNDRGQWTVPAGDLYPHQWLWDSCFTAIGLRHIDVERAKLELLSLARGQWSNGMLPNIVFSKSSNHLREHDLWRSQANPYAPADTPTSGITQPPMLAEAVVKIGDKLRMAERRTWFKQVYPMLLSYHEWLYRERNPHGEGLIILVHPWESGLDSSPPWISELRKHSMPAWVRLFEKLHLDFIVNFFRRDTRHTPPGQRISNVEALAYWSALRRLRRKAYNWEAILSRSLFAVEDLAFNCILIRANTQLKYIAKTIGQDLPKWLADSAASSEQALEKLWDEHQSQYFSRSFISHKLIEEPTVAAFLPLYAGTIPPERAKLLVNHLTAPGEFGLKYPVPSVPKSSAYFHEFRYWQGPTWVNINWLIIDGLERYGFNSEARALREKTLEVVEANGMSEYFSPLSGKPAGASDFSWTAALAIDLAKTS